jgi:hypothetical protein
VSLEEVKRQVENALIVTAKEFGEMAYGRPETFLFRGFFAESVLIGSANHQVYLRILSILQHVKCA